LLLLHPAARQQLRAPDQEARVDADCPADQAKYDNRANSKSTTTAGYTACTPPILDLIAFRQLIYAHERLT
jgi:hypothetical protein